MASGRRSDPRLPSPLPWADPRPAPHLAPKLLLQLPVVVVPDQEVQGEVAAVVAAGGHGEKAAAGPSPPAWQASASAGSPAPARPAAGERENAASEGRGTRRGGLGRVTDAREVGGRGPGRGRGSAAPTPRPAALPPALTASEPTSAGRTAPNWEVHGANQRKPRRGEARPDTGPRVGPIPPTPSCAPENTVQSQNRAKTLSLSPGPRRGKLGLPFTSPFLPAPATSHGSAHNWASSIDSEFRG